MRVQETEGHCKYLSLKHPEHAEFEHLQFLRKPCFYCWHVTGVRQHVQGELWSYRRVLRGNIDVRYRKSGEEECTASAILSCAKDAFSLTKKYTNLSNWLVYCSWHKWYNAKQKLDRSGTLLLLNYTTVSNPTANEQDNCGREKEPAMIALLYHSTRSLGGQ